jgi:hypothetical protein
MGIRPRPARRRVALDGGRCASDQLLSTASTSSSIFFASPNNMRLFSL